MSDVKLADCRVAFNFEVAPNGAEVWDERPMTEDDLDSLIRERGVTAEMVERALDIIALEGFTERSRRLIVEGVLEAVFQARKEAE